MTQPDPNHPITVAPAMTRWRAVFAGHVIADSADALVLNEKAYPPVIYFPREDVEMAFLSRTDRHTHCPHKGDAAYYTIARDGRIAENAVWTYETPYAHVAPIAGRLAFYPDQVELHAVDDAAVNPHHRETDVDAIVQHTDAGDGRSQREHWPANVETPGLDGGGR
ncbi:DUF427 domain-containing protein [Phenylobacterium sp.]|uniref:DUF427 domain-containing protein n=1 Tax=Phenylobacterium sp. TaxID=1871053 RepID=UPI00301D06FF